MTPPCQPWDTLDAVPSSSTERSVTHSRTSYSTETRQSQLKRTRQNKLCSDKVPESPTKGPAKKLIKHNIEAGQLTDCLLLTT